MIETFKDFLAQIDIASSVKAMISWSVVIVIIVSCLTVFANLTFTLLLLHFFSLFDCQFVRKFWVFPEIQFLEKCKKWLISVKPNCVITPILFLTKNFGNFKKMFRQKIITRARSHGRVVKAENSLLSGCGFEYRHSILDGCKGC